MRWLFVTAFVWLGACTALCNDLDDLFGGDSGVDAKKVDAAVKRAAQWLLSKQNPDGSWKVSGKGQLLEIESHYPGGVTALILYALLKAGIDPKDPRIVKGFQFCRRAPDLQLRGEVPRSGAAPHSGQNFTSARTYSVSCMILALAAKYQPRVKSSRSRHLIRKLMTSADKLLRRGFRKADPRDKQFLSELVEWLIKTQHTNIWRYPGPAQDGNWEDASNTQYAMLALYTAWRLGYKIPPSVWEKVIQWFLKNQDKDGPKVKWFPVPGADIPMKELRRLEKKSLSELKRMLRKVGASGLTPDMIKKLRTSVVIDNPYRKFGPEKKEMRARGWSYVRRGGAPKFPSFEHTCGSMTTSGIVSLMICKAALEGTPIWRKYRKQVEQAIRDGVAWLAHNFTVSRNPNKGGYHFYYLYGMERAGVLTLTRLFGKHNWYKEGAEFLLAHQRPDGSWHEQGDSPLIATAFAILFLKKATAPVVRIPHDVATGAGMFGNKKK